MDILSPSGARAAQEVVERLALGAGKDGRPRVAAAMIASLDGRATIDGRSGGLGHPADRELFRELRTAADAVLVGRNTIIVERYADLLDDHQRDRRIAAGLGRDPVLATVDRHGHLAPDDVPIFGEEKARVRVYREQDGPSFDEAAAAVRVVEMGEGEVDFPAILADLYEHDDVRGVTCEGGPRLLHELVSQGCLDDLVLTIAPLLAGGAGPTILTGDALPDPHRLELVDIHRADDHLFLHYVPKGGG